MIRFALRCGNGHGFESWFQSNDAFDGLKRDGLVTCPSCQSAEIDKDLMSPGVRPARKTSDPAPQPMTNAPDVAEAIKALKAHVEKNSDYVGNRFAEEARAMHLGDKPSRSIHGEARPEEARKLIEDGVPALPLPFIPRQKTN
ncbi:DUF1178 family protein [Silicimonas algicola]|uniref:DUF1178 family protein n=1 Tax=Silicimonas algicola TaxID=1826607 RepID=A0A316GC76_9RHOB|nr:DUF1178 family protein [Silicimonas algicola]AZQ66219.1 DUF1178 family protein [Silicimonas algicola]PWK58531.1 hypothetical protein C8D95_101345 [Silicimonas algicola]